MADKLIRVAKFTNSLDAHLAQMRLEANGIDSALMGEDSASMLPLPQFTSIELCVVSEQVDDAVRILEPEG